MGDSPKWVKSKRRRKKRRERLNDGNNNGQATHGARKHTWRTHARTHAAWAKKDRTMLITMAKLRMAHAWRTHGKHMNLRTRFIHGARKPPGPKRKRDRKMVITMASYALQMPPRVVHAKPLGQNKCTLEINKWVIIL